MKAGRLLGLLLVVSVAAGSCSDEEGDCVQPEPMVAPDLAQAIAGLQGLTLQEFFEASFRALLLRSPETLTEAGLAESMGRRHDQLDNISDAFRDGTQQLVAAILTALRAYDRSEQSVQEQRSSDIYALYLEDWQQSDAFRYHSYPVNQTLTGVQQILPLFLTDLHPITSKAAAEDYVARLRQVALKFDQLIELLNTRERRGIVAPRFIFEWSRYLMQSYVNASADEHAFYGSYKSKLSSVPGLASSDRETLLAQSRTAIRCHVIPAYEKLDQTLARLQGSAPSEDGVWQFDQGEAYYAQALRHHTTTEMTADDIHELGLQEVARIRAAMNQRFENLNYPLDGNLPSLFDRVANDSGFVSGTDVIARYETIIDEAEQKVDVAFELKPAADVVVRGGDGGAFYVSAARDGSRPGTFYAPVGGSPEPLFGMRTLAYHEAVPGHHFQIGIAQELDLPTFRTEIGFTAFAEGWALYAERLAADLDWYKGDVHGDLGRLQAEAFRAARLVVDTGIHAKRWSFEDALTYMVDNVGYDREMLRYEVGRYIAWPGQATAYKIGMLRILELRQGAQTAMAADFDLKRFHTAVIGNGSLPMSILEQVVQTYVQAPPASP